MKQTFFFYDLETSGISSRDARIMQFGGQRTDMELNPIGEPFNILVRLDEDILPEPDAILITGITPQKANLEGISEKEFFETFLKDIATEGTIFVGFNNIRFDDEFIRFGLYRNFGDPYEWQWSGGRSKWDLLDIVRMTRALRPEGIKWPVDSEGKPTNRLELLTSMNNLSHAAAHDALSDVFATISVAKMIKIKQPKLFDYLLTMRDKKKVEVLIGSKDPFVYVSGRYQNEYQKLSVVINLGSAKDGSYLVYDLRTDPTAFMDLEASDLAKLWHPEFSSKEREYFPVKLLKTNRCPAIAPMGVLRNEDMDRLTIDLENVKKHIKILKSSDKFVSSLLEAHDLYQKKYTQTAMLGDPLQVDSQLYDGFFGEGDKSLISKFNLQSPDQISTYTEKFSDPRLKSLVPLYKARNYPKLLSDEERSEWEKFKHTKMSIVLPKFYARLEEISTRPGLTKNQTYSLEELKLYAESIMPIDY